MLSRIEPGEECQFHYVEPEDMFGIGFHLKGGARFDLGHQRFETRPLDVWAGAAPRGSGSRFDLPAHGFRTISLRFEPDAARDLLSAHDKESGPLADILQLSEREPAMARLAPLDPGAAALAQSMFETPFTGAARGLFLESCALGLLAAQIDAVSRAARSERAGTLARREKMLEARRHLDAHLADPPTITKLARVVGTNEFTLKKAFKEMFGTSIFGYVRQRRMERAAHELHGGMSVRGAALSVGYECPRCFADAFRRHFGALPSQVLRSAVGDIPARYG